MRIIIKKMTDKKNSALLHTAVLDGILEAVEALLKTKEIQVNIRDKGNRG